MTLDFIIIYEDTAKSAQDSIYQERAPFSEKTSRAIYNDAYAYLLTRAGELGLSGGFATVHDVSAPGTVSAFWSYEGEWKREKKTASTTLVYLKASPKDDLHKNSLNLLFSDQNVRSVSRREITKAFKSKLLTHQLFPDFTVPTVNIGEMTAGAFDQAKKELATILTSHPHKDDFGEELVIKDTYGSSGINVIKVVRDASYETVMNKLRTENIENGKVSYILQPFVKYDTGFVIGPHTGMIDLRLWIMGEKHIGSSIRIAKKGEFRANVHQGGTELAIDREDVPDEVYALAKTIQQTVDLSTSFYALDFIRSNHGTVYFIEGNSAPGIDWVPGDSVFEQRQKKVIDELVTMFHLMIR